MWPCRRNIEKVLLRGFLFGFSAIIVLALLPLVARDLPGGGPLLYGVLLGVMASGPSEARSSAAWCAVNGRTRRSLAPPSSASLSASPSSRSAQTPGSLAAALMIGGTCWVLALAMFNVTVQLSTPRWVLGRALALYQAATFGGMALGGWIWGLVAEEYGSEPRCSPPPA